MKIKIIVINTLIIGCLLKGIYAQAQSIKLVNPILSGFYPDPSIVKVGADYYLVNSTFAYFPGLPLFHSKDLKNWKQVANIIDRDSQMNFIGDRMTRGLFAPGISYNKGTFYVTCTNIDHRGNFVVTAANPAGPWSNPVWLPEVKGIDPSIFFDADKAYIVYNSDAPDNKPAYSGHRTIRIYELDIQNLKITGEEKILVNGGVDISKKPVWIEGPHILKRNDWYYLYAAEGGTSVNHSEVVFRSKRVDGPYVPYEHNPILTQRDLPEDRKYPVTSTGHAQFVEGPDNKTYAVFLGVRPYTGDYYNTGRETFIAPVEWKNDWPVINPGKGEIKYEYTAAYKEVKLGKALPQSGNFSYTLTFDKGIDASLLFLRSRDTASYSFNKQAGLILKLKPETCMGTGTPSFVGKRQQHLICTAETELTFSPQKDNEKAGLVIFQDEKHFYFLGKCITNGKNVLQLYKSKDDKKTMEVIAEVPLTPNAKPVQLRIDADGENYSCYYAVEQGKWILLKDKLDAKFLSTHEAGGFIGCIFGLYATSSGETGSNTASFKYLRYSGNDQVYKQ
ncbi:glycoside hydrolase family 43 protein [Mucilaginibacter paludis]|uniref:Glycoside hydrolase family 43 n=1 Tax=Mucilaginibacter paludis DSM 18603 TaxID=714943 RepID=H1YFR6_9SPHI|nr:glycoside hydrolase family 43 protein [Mucilaginibacter paludis]EHQ25307.1 glycoside hydrolase family 43 [Mucilaginibacter paludis DSM 18603]